jgi:chemotaxis regulatin CheY-phosphate phosphatase CheZ
MKKKHSYNKNMVVTVGVLEEILNETLQKLVVTPLKEFRGEFDDLKGEFHAHVEMTSRTTEITMNELTANRQAVEHLEQTVQTFNRGLVINENSVKNLSERVLKLEMAK